MNLITNPAAQAKFADAVLALVAPAKAHAKTGNQDGEQSISFVKTELRYNGWKIGGDSSDFEDTLEAAGFSLRRTGAPQYRVYVTL